MAHLRSRGITASFLKKLKQWPVVSVFGPRQCGKSTFLRELAFRAGQSTYYSLDKSAVKDRVKSNPELFLKSFEKSPLILDEAHKVPQLFDEIKAQVDENLIPGRFVLTGSVEFSQKVGVFESLTGRVGSIHMDSLTLAETLSKQKFSLHEIQFYLERGGMPVACFLRDAEMRLEYWEQWLEKLTRQDIKQFSQGRLSSDLSLQILQKIAVLPEPNAAYIASALKVDTRRINTHLEALAALFVIHPVYPEASSTGKTRWYPYDCGLAYFLGGSLNRRFEAYFLHHQRNTEMIRTGHRLRICFYRNLKGNGAEFSVAGTLYKVVETPVPSKHQIMTAEALRKKFPEKRVIFLCATDEQSYLITRGIRAVPWSGL